MGLSKIRITNLALTALGAALFIALCSYVSFAPKDFDERTKEFAIAKVGDKVGDTIASFNRSKAANRIAEAAQKLSPRLGAEVEQMRGQLDARASTFIADILTASCKLDCEKKEQARADIQVAFDASVEKHGMTLARIESVVNNEYDGVMAELRTDLRIFAGSNAIALAFAFLLSLFRGRASAHLLPISITLTGATLLMVPWYVFGQDWVMTLLFSDYWGWSYSVFLAAISCLLLDIAFNAAKITSAVLNFFFNAIGSALHFSPC